MGRPALPSLSAGSLESVEARGSGTVQNAEGCRPELVPNGSRYESPHCPK